MAVSSGLVESKANSLRRVRRGRKSFFTPEGKLASAFLKMYTGLSAPKLTEALNGNIQYQIIENTIINMSVFRPPGLKRCTDNDVFDFPLIVLGVSSQVAIANRNARIRCYLDERRHNGRSSKGVALKSLITNILSLVVASKPRPGKDPFI